MDIEERLKQLQNKLDSRMNDIQQRSNSTMDRYGIQSPAPTFTANTAGNSFCPQCGASVENDAMFCNMCGSRLVTSAVQENKNERRKRYSPVSTVLYCALRPPLPAATI